MTDIPTKEIQQCLLNFQSLLNQSSILIHGIDAEVITETESVGPTDDLNDDNEREEEEDDAALLKRAFSVHSALFLSLCNTSCATDPVNCVNLANALVVAILQNGDVRVEGEKDEKAIALHELARSLFSALYPSERNAVKNKYLSKEQWRKVGITNALLAIQYLLHLMQTGTSNNNSNEVLVKGWNIVILPILFGLMSSNASISKKHQSASLLLKNNALRHTLFNSRPSTLPTMKSRANCSGEIVDQCRSSCSICLAALQGITSPEKKTFMRQTIIVVICEVLLGLLEFSAKCNDHECVEAVKDAIHQAALIIIRRVCYETVHTEKGSDGAEKIKVQSRVLSLEAVRPITGMLLPQLYGKDVEAPNERRMLEIWHEILLLLSPYSTSFVHVDLDETSGGEGVDGTRRHRCCHDWNDVAPMVATSILCIILPTFRKMELPTTLQHDNESMEKELFCRPAYSSSVWHLIRKGLGRFGETDNFGGSARNGGSGPLDDEAVDKIYGDGLFDITSPESRDQLLRRRCSHILRILLEYERVVVSKKAPAKGSSQESGNSDDVARKLVDLWTKYVLCFEMLEMEIELHLVDQVWPTLIELCAACKNPSSFDDGGKEVEPILRLPSIVWDDIASVLSLVLLSDAPTMRKLGLFRFLGGYAGIESTVTAKESGTVQNSVTESVYMKNPKAKYKIKKKTGIKTSAEPAPLSIVSIGFVVDVVIRSYDSLIGTKVGTNIQIDEGGKLISEDVTCLLKTFMSNYVKTLATAEEDNCRLSSLVSAVFGSKLIDTHKIRTVALLYRSVADALESDERVTATAALEPATISATIRSIQAAFASGGAPKLLQVGLMRDVSLALKHTLPWQKPDVSLILQVLAMYPPEDASFLSEGSSRFETTESKNSESLARSALCAWVRKLGDGKWSTNAAPALATAFVSGQLLPFVETELSLGVDKAEREMAMSICTLCSLEGNPSELLWPAIHKGLQSIPSVSCTKTPAIYRATRSVTLLEFGCLEGALSGIGNGELVYDENNRTLMPPPQSIEAMLSNAVQFLMLQLMSMPIILEGDTSDTNDGGASRSSSTGNASTYIATLISQIKIMHEAFPTSRSLSCAVDDMLQKSSESLAAGCCKPIDSVIYLTLSFAALSCGASPKLSFDNSKEKLNHIVRAIQVVVDTTFSFPEDMVAKKAVVQAYRSVFQYAKWGTLSLYLPMLAEFDSADIDAVLLLGQSKKENTGDDDQTCTSDSPRPAEKKPVGIETANAVSSTSEVKSISSDGGEDMGLHTVIGDEGTVCDGESSGGSNMGLDNLFGEDNSNEGDNTSSNGSDMGLDGLFGEGKDDDYDDSDREDVGLGPLISDDDNKIDKDNRSSEPMGRFVFETQCDTPSSGLYRSIFELAKDSVQATPIIALTPLFQTAVKAGEHLLSLDSTGNSDFCFADALLESLGMVIEILFSVLEDISNSSTWMYMLNTMCNLIFNPKLLELEYERQVAGQPKKTPIFSAFERLMRLAGGTKPHISTVAVSKISVAWAFQKDSNSSDMGLCAIPYRTHIASLLIHKECKLDDSTANQALSKNQWDKLLPKQTHYLSITRGFVLLFLSKLPDANEMCEIVLKDLVHFIILYLLDNVCCAKVKAGDIFISGSVEYAKRSRAWQALCLLHRFVTDDIALLVASRVFQAMSMNSHGQIRYFMEIFTIQGIRKHPHHFGEHLAKEIRRADLSLQYLSSLMIIGGNVIANPRYQSEFFTASTSQRVKDILCGVIPWLSSTQGFSRAIAQLLVHKLIPIVADTSLIGLTEDNALTKDEAVLKKIYSFLEQNSDMRRLRGKQQNFFNSYDVENACSLEGLLSIPVDDGDEANPDYMVDAIKTCLADVYQEAHEGDAPAWKQLEDLLVKTDQIKSASLDGDSPVQSEGDLVNFQRKILPLDALDLSMKLFQEQKLLNAAGKKKQKLIVCATLVDKVPNLGGLARTAEIFAAQKLVVPDLFVKRLDSFKSISASANDWIDMEECKEEDLLNWLHKMKKQMYTIIGLEQTSSSKCITKMDFPEKTVLLLGKEKEGIPVEFLAAVDHCIEIPQLGIIRSLNVHVTGAIAIWKYTEQMMQRNNRIS